MQWWLLSRDSAAVPHSCPLLRGRRKHSEAAPFLSLQLQDPFSFQKPSASPLPLRGVLGATGGALVRGLQARQDGGQGE